MSKNRPNRRYSLILCCGDVRQKPRIRKTNQIEDLGAAAVAAAALLLLLLILNSLETDIFHFVLAADNAPDRTHRRYFYFFRCGDDCQKPRCQKTDQIEDILYSWLR